ncbi:Gp19/Gp15/Gp42 family protein [Ornithinimicrobium sp. LYQ92]|uniref:Gp19/Gp15/Gp42 family protein n=1 Tax=Serinicoccus sp. LYQ92 TaxID=3378798 RepID=UPI003854C717
MQLPLVDPDDIRLAAYGVRIPEGNDVDDQLAALIAKAGRELLSRVPNLADRVAAGKVTDEDIKDVIEAMVVRVIRNPSGYRQVGIDDFQATIDTTLSAGGLYLSDDEREKLAGRRKARRFGTARLSLPPWRIPNV